MAESIVSSLLSTTQFVISYADADSGTSRVTVKNLKVAKVNFKFVAQPQRSTREDGAVIVDSKTILQTVVKLSVYCENVDDLRQVNDLLTNRSRVYTLSSKGILIENVVLNQEHVRQTPEVLSAYPIDLEFTEIIVQSKQPVLVNQAADAKTISQGLAAISAQAQQTVTGLVAAVKQSSADLSRQVTGFFS